MARTGWGFKSVVRNTIVVHVVLGVSGSKQGCSEVVNNVAGEDGCMALDTWKLFR